VRQIIARGGGGYSMEPIDLAMNQYILAQTGKEQPKVCFLPTASSNPAEGIVRFYSGFTQLDCRPSHLSLFASPTADLKAFLLQKDLIYVGGGNTKSMLALWREWGLVEILREAWENGTVLAGGSAGAICWFEQGSTDSIPGELTSLDCMGFLSGSCCPHYDTEAGRRPSYHRMMSAGEILPGLAVDNYAALHFVDDELARVVSSDPEARAYRVELCAGEVVERALDAVLL